MRTSGSTAMHRSYLYVPGDRDDLAAKAFAGEADAVVLDLEDAVAADRKDRARRVVSEILAQPTDKPCYVRINPLGSELATRDLEAVAQGHLEGIRVPKAESAADIARLCADLDARDSAAVVFALFESALGVERAPEILSAHSRVLTGSLGEQDLLADVGIHGEAAFAYPRSRLVFAARAAGCLPPVQSVWVAIDDLEGLRATCAEGERFGFFGRSAIHPRQLGPINEAYTPSASAIAHAREIIEQSARAAEQGKGALRLDDGSFVDEAVVRQARRTLDLAERVGAA